MKKRNKPKNCCNKWIIHIYVLVPLKTVAKSK
jgi:hypothetical protein